MFPNSKKGNVSLVCDECIAEEKEKFRNAGHQIKPGNYLKHRFVSPDGGTESMWVKVTEVIDEEIVHGVLSNDPILIPELKHGMLVEIELSECLGYLPGDE